MHKVRHPPLQHPIGSPMTPLRDAHWLSAFAPITLVMQNSVQAIAPPIAQKSYGD